MRARCLPQVLRNIVTLTLASAGACACGDSSSLGSDMEQACTGLGTSTSAMSGWKPGTPVDFMVRRSETVVIQTAGAEPKLVVNEMDRTGEPCKTATDRAACEKQVAELHVVTESTCKVEWGTSREPTRTNCDALYVLFTRGDQVFALKTTPEIEEFLRPIDTKEEAIFVASSKTNLSGGCTGNDQVKWKQTGDGFEVLLYDYAGSCSPSGGHVDGVVVRVSENGDVSEVEREKARDTGPCSEGRRPCGLRSSGRAKKFRSNLGAWFARASHLEAASVVAFAQLERELEALGAPARILRALARARSDEVRHADVTSRLAKRFGATPPAVRVKRGRNRSALAIAIENAREGCVRETLGAVIALHRAERAKDAEIARAMRSIARDELRHARLSWELMEWLDAQLTARGRAAVRRAFEREIASLETELAGPPTDVAEIAGAPDERTQRMLFARVSREVWKPALAA
jgi:hypothetical protein